MKDLRESTREPFFVKRDDGKYQLIDAKFVLPEEWPFTCEATSFPVQRFQGCMALALMLVCGVSAGLSGRAVNNHLISILVSMAGGLIWRNFGVETLFLIAAPFGFGSFLFSLSLSHHRQNVYSVPLRSRDANTAVPNCSRGLTAYPRRNHNQGPLE